MNAINANAAATIGGKRDGHPTRVAILDRGMRIETAAAFARQCGGRVLIGGHQRRRVYLSLPSATRISTLAQWAWENGLIVTMGDAGITLRRRAEEGV